MENYMSLMDALSQLGKKSGIEQLAKSGINSYAEMITATIHANNKGNSWIKHLGKLECKNNTAEGKKALSDALERIDVQLKADKSIMILMDPKLAKDLTRRLHLASNILNKGNQK